MRVLIFTAMWMAILVGFPQSTLADRAEAREFVTKGKLQEERGNLTMALELYQRGIASDPDFALAYERALPIWMKTGEISVARTQLELLTLRCGESVFGWYGLGAIYRKQGRFDLAIMAYEAYLAKRPQDADAYFGLALALVASHDSSAKDALERYLTLEKRPERARYRAHAKVILQEIWAREPITISPAVQKLLAEAAVARENGAWLRYGLYRSLALLFIPISM